MSHGGEGQCGQGCANLEDLYDKCPANDIKIVLVDFNAKVGQKGIFGSLSASSPNGVTLIDSAAVRNMVVCSTMFQHRDIHNATWLSPD